MERLGIVLTGGGARGAYQAGVLLALGEILKYKNLVGKKNPIRVWNGTSAGAINASFCAAHADDLPEGTQKLAELWRNIRPNQVYETSMYSLSSNSFRWIRDLSFGPMIKTKVAQNLLNTHPLLDLLQGEIPFTDIQTHIDNECLDALICSAYCYNNAKTISFVQANRKTSWERSRRLSTHTKIGAQHILASCSIPVLFPPTQVGDLYYGDGGFRNTSPLSPSIYFEAYKLLLIGVRYASQDQKTLETAFKPSVARIAGSVLNALFMDNLDLDLERLAHINEILAALGDSVKTARSEYHPVECHVVRPSRNLSKIAEDRPADAFPLMVNFLLGGLGSRKETSDLASYILFETTFTSQLIDLGYADLMSQAEDIEQWLLGH